MLNKIEIKNIFAHKNTTVEFKEGLTRLHGPNEAGKSQVFEMVRFALFGSKALRTSASDYAGGSVELTFNEDYRVHRTIGNATLHKGDELLARSTTAVNKKIIEIIGYGLKTFDNVNSIQQDEVQKLTKLKAEDRKKFLDELIGAAQIDSLIADYKAEGQAELAEINALERHILNAVEPKHPGVESVEVIEGRLDELTGQRALLGQQERRVELLQNDLYKIKMFPDSMPDRTLEELEAELDNSASLQAAINKARMEYPMIARLYDMGARTLDVVELKRDVDAVVAGRNAPKPQYTIEEVKEFQEKHKANDAHIEVLRLRAELETYTRCPGFAHEQQEVLNEIKALLPIARPYSGLPSKEALVESLTLTTNYKEVTVDSVYAKAFSERVEFDQTVFDKIIKILDQPLVDAMGLVNAITAKRKQTEVAEKQAALEYEKKLLDPIVIEQLDTNIKKLREERSVRQRYDAELRHYIETLKKNTETESKLGLKKAAHAETLKVVKAVQGFKYYINTYFLPSVSKAATAMLITMTNGKWKKVTITDKFEISVDGKEVEALSGSTKAIVNIALRFALQFVLTKNSFSVFMADEVDGAMDADRANYLNECLGNMTAHIKQVIVISHKDIVAPNNIKL